jgi:hypothetical protein
MRLAWVKNNCISYFDEKKIHTKLGRPKRRWEIIVIRQVLMRYIARTGSR